MRLSHFTEHHYNLHSTTSPCSVVTGVHEMCRLQVNVFNNLPDDYPQVTDGISVHWYGSSLSC